MCNIRNGKNVEQGIALSGIEGEYFSSSEVNTETSYAGKYTQAKPQLREEQESKNGQEKRSCSWSLSQPSRR